VEIGRTRQRELRCWLRVSPQQRESVRAQLFRWNDIVEKWLAGHGVVDDANAPVKSIGWIQQFTKITKPHRDRRYGNRRGRRPSPANPFLPPEKEHLVPFTIETDRRKQHRPTQRVAKLVIPEWLRGALWIVGKPAARAIARRIQAIALKTVRVECGISK